MYIERTFGPLVGTIAGAGLWGASMLKTVVALVGFKAYIWALEELIGITIDIEIAFHYIDKNTLYKSVNEKKSIDLNNLNNSKIRDIY